MEDGRIRMYGRTLIRRDNSLNESQYLNALVSTFARGDT